MPLKLVAPIMERIFLDKSDAEMNNTGEPTYVDVRQARMMDTERRADVSSKRTMRQGQGDQSISIETRFNWAELMRFDVNITLSGSNILDEDGRELFRFTSDPIPHLDMTEYEFNRAWSKLPEFIASEIHAGVLKVNPDWDNRTEDEEDF